MPTSTEIAPGIYPGIPFAEYHRWPGVNFSKLKLFERSPAHAREEMLHPSEPTVAMALGTAVHSAVLEPDRFAAEYVVAPECDRRTKIGKETWAKFEAENPGTILSEEDSETCQGISTAVWAHPVAKELLSSRGSKEVCVVWDDQDTGLRCKARIDVIGSVAGWPVIADLKSVGDGIMDATPDGFSKACARYLYHVQAAHYLAGAEALHSHQRKFWHIAVEKSAPYGCAVYELSEGALAQGEQQRRRWLHRMKECEATGNWPGYPQTVQPIDIPKWAQETLE
jgi:hypothetical protein